MISMRGGMKADRLEKVIPRRKIFRGLLFKRRSQRITTARRVLSGMPITKQINLKMIMLTLWFIGLQIPPSLFNRTAVKILLYWRLSFIFVLMLENMMLFKRDHERRNRYMFRLK